MYTKGLNGWLKHYDFIILDLICVQVAFLLSYIARHGFVNPYISPLYRNMAIFIELSDFIILLVFENFKNILKRGYYQEFIKTLKHVVIVELVSVMYLFTLQESQDYSRTALYLMGVFYITITYIARITWKTLLHNKRNVSGKNSLVIVTNESMAKSVISNIKLNNYERFKIVGIVIVDKDISGDSIMGIPVVANKDTASKKIYKEWVDEIFVNIDLKYPYPKELVDQFIDSGITLHINLARVSEKHANKKFIERIGGYTVITESINYTNLRQAFAKRSLDIVVSFIGCIITVVLMLLIAPIIYISSPGPIFFSQIRIGKNGKKFKMYKFRSMYMDAEERKKELLKENIMKDGRMFKVDFDTRVIGNRILPNGSKKTGVGYFLRATSLDEFPQFFNVLKGDMSLIGTRPPTVGEWLKYSNSDRVRMTIRPGITGLWQVSGRSKITDFNEVVKLDTKYITEWSMGLDLKILAKTIWVVLLQDGSM